MDYTQPYEHNNTFKYLFYTESCYHVRMNKQKLKFDRIVKNILAKNDWDESRLAKEAKTTQASINRIKKGITVAPNYFLGDRLVSIYESL